MSEGRVISIRRLSLVAEHLSCKQKVKGSIPLIAFFIIVCVVSSVCVHSFCHCVCGEEKLQSVCVRAVSVEQVECHRCVIRSTCGPMV